MRPSATLLFGIAYTAAIGVIAWMQGTISPVPFHPTFFHLAILTGIAVILAVSLNMVNGFTGQFSLGHAAFLGIGMYAALFLANRYGPQAFAALPGPAVARQTVMLLALMAVGGTLAALGGLLVGLPSLRLRGDYLAIVTLGFGEILRIIVQNIPALGGALSLSIAPGRLYAPVPSPAGTDAAATARIVPEPAAFFFWVGLVALATVMVARNLMLSGPGRAFLAVREDEVAAEAVGVNTYRAKVLAFILAAVFAGFAGVLNGLWANYADPSLAGIGFLRSIEIVVMVVLGGLGSVSGAVIAAVFLTVVPALLRDVPFYSAHPELRLVSYALLLIILMLLRPQGLFGTAEISWAGLTRRRVRSSAPRGTGGGTGASTGHEPAGGLDA